MERWTLELNSRQKSLKSPNLMFKVQNKIVQKEIEIVQQILRDRCKEKISIFKTMDRIATKVFEFL